MFYHAIIYLNLKEFQKFNLSFLRNIIKNNFNKINLSKRIIN